MIPPIILAFTPLKIVRTILFLLGGGITFAVIALIGAYIYAVPSLPPISEIRQIQVQTPLRVYSRDGALIATFGDKRRIPVTLDRIPADMINAFLAAEDDRFYDHPGVDYAGLVRAAWSLIITGERRQGGSTITMQLARNFFLTKQRTFERKIREIFLALMIERVFEKDEILNLYLNKIFLGKRAYGVAAAAEVYYGKTIDALSLTQIAMIAGLPKAPSFYNPLANPAKAVERRDYVLGRMLALGMIDKARHDHAQQAPISAGRHGLNIELNAPYVAEMVRKEMVEQHGAEAYTSGFKVHTTIDGKLQRSANKSLHNGLLRYDRRHGWRGAEKQITAGAGDFAARVERTLAELSPVGRLLPGVVTGVSSSTLSVVLKDGRRVALGPSAWGWARAHLNEDSLGESPDAASRVASVGDVVRIVINGKEVRLAQIPEVAGALVALNPDTGALLALDGGFNFGLSKFNRATQSMRQPGSSFKPFIYSAALAEGYTPATIVIDTPVVFSSGNFDWRPENYSEKFFGPTRLRVALKKSRNLVSVKLVDDVGIDETLDHIRRFGFKRRNHPHNMTLALGSGTVSPLEMARAYAAFANGGFAIEPYVIEAIEMDATPVFQAAPLNLCVEGCDEDAAAQYARRIIPADAAYQMTSMMQDVIRTGTGRRARALRRGDIAGKTGTTNEQRDAWFSGFNRDVVCTVWVGFDDHKPLGNRETGSVAALPIWIDFMRGALEGRPEREYYKPANIVTARINRDNGLIAHPSDDSAVVETFREEYLPKEIAAPEDEAGKEREAPGLF